MNLHDCAQKEFLPTKYTLKLQTKFNCVPARHKSWKKHETFEGTLERSKGWDLRHVPTCSEVWCQSRCRQDVWLGVLFADLHIVKSMTKPWQHILLVLRVFWRLHENCFRPLIAAGQALYAQTYTTPTCQHFCYMFSTCRRCTSVLAKSKMCSICYWFIAQVFNFTNTSSGCP